MTRDGLLRGTVSSRADVTVRVDPEINSPGCGIDYVLCFEMKLLGGITEQVRETKNKNFQFRQCWVSSLPGVILIHHFCSLIPAADRFAGRGERGRLRLEQPRPRALCPD